MDEEKGWRAAKIAFAMVECSLGRALVAGTERGVCALYFGDTDAEMEAALRREFPRAEIDRDDAAMGEWTGALVKHLAGVQPSLDLPLDIRATAFERRVWEELRKIPYGERRTYAEIARALGDPKSVRAVGHACASNPAAVAIPCHRVVRGDGGLGGYRWGLKRKQALLDAEAETFRRHLKPGMVAVDAGAS